MKRTLDIDSWNRKEHFQFFSQFDEPFFGVATSVDCTAAVRYAKEQKLKFSLYYLHKSIQASNEIEAFRYRIAGEKVVIHEKIHGTMTVIRADHTFGFTHFEYHPDFKVFSEMAKQSILKTKQSSGLGFNDSTQRDDSIHYTATPWFSFTGISHARNSKIKDSVPKIAFGKYQEINGLLQMPISIHAHHGLMDGYHVSLFLEAFQRGLNDSKCTI